MPTRVVLQPVLLKDSPATGTPPAPTTAHGGEGPLAVDAVGSALRLARHAQAPICRQHDHEERYIRHAVRLTLILLLPLPGSGEP